MRGGGSKVKKNAIIPLRNFAIAVLALILFASVNEAMLAASNRKPENYDSVRDENPHLLLLQSERSMNDNSLFAAEINAYNVAQMYETLDFVPEFNKKYPLVDINSKIDSEESFNIVVIGDSFVWGAGTLNRNELFWRLLENDLRKEGKNVNVYGVGVTAANAYEELAWLTDGSLVEDLDPDLVIFGYVYNDPDYFITDRGGLVDMKGKLGFLEPLKKFFPNTYQALIESIIARTMYTEKYSDGDYVHLGYEGAPPVLKGRFYEKYKADFVEKLDAYAATVDFPIAVMTLPTLPNNVMVEQLHKPLDGLYAQCKNIRFYNCIEEYNDFASPKHSKNYQVNVADFHAGSATNRFYADYIKEYILTDYADDIGNLPQDYKAESAYTINDYLPYGVSPVKISEDEKSVTYEIEYPSTDEPYNMHGIEVSPYYLVNPLGREHIRLSFADDVKISSVRTDGQYDDIQLYYTRTNEKLGYDDHTVYDFSRKDGSTFGVEDGESVASVLISADYSQGKDRKIEIIFEK